MKRCATDTCDEELSNHAVSEYCKRCRAGFSYWRKKRPAQVLERRRKLTLYSERMEVLIGDRGIKP